MYFTSISWNPWLRISMCITIGSMLIPKMSWLFFGCIQIASSFLTCFLMRLCCIPLIKPTNIIFRCLNLLVSLMMSKKEDYVTWALERCHDMLKSRYISPKVIVTNWDNALINSIYTVFLNALCEYCWNKGCFTSIPLKFWW